MLWDKETSKFTTRMVVRAVGAEGRGRSDKINFRRENRGLL